MRKLGIVGCLITVLLLLMVPISGSYIQLRKNDILTNENKICDKNLYDSDFLDQYCNPDPRGSNCSEKVLAQSFCPGDYGPEHHFLSKIEIYVKAVGHPKPLTVSLRKDDKNGSTLASVIIPFGNTNPCWVSLNVNPLIIHPGYTYWIIVNQTNSNLGGNYSCWFYGDSDYEQGYAYVYKGSSWDHISYDLAFRTYLCDTKPEIPSAPVGPISGLIGISYTYSTSSWDADFDAIKYGWDWDGNGIADEWSTLIPASIPSTPCSMSHSWTVPGTYHVMVKAQDECGVESSWSTAFNVTISLDNYPPNKPITPTGPNSGITGNTYSYYSSAVDPDGNQIYLKFSWGDRNESNWVGPYDSGKTITESHTWSSDGSYSVRVKAKDTKGAESVWSDPLPITMPYSYNQIHHFLERLFQRFPNAFPILRQLMEY